MNQKKDRSVISLILSALSLMVGVVWAGATVIIMGSMGTDVPAWRLGMLIAFSALFLFLGIRGLLRYRSRRKAAGGKTGKAVPIILGIVGVLLVAQMALVFPSMWREGKMDRAMKPYVQEEYADEDGKLPEDPWFVFYHNGRFSIPSSRYYRGTDDPKKVNLVVEYSESVSRNGAWVNKETGQKVSDALVQNVTLKLIRLEDWALIDTVSFSLQLKEGENGVNVLGMNSVQSYLNGLGQQETED